MTNAREKGKRGELEAAELLRSHGFEARRGQQYCGGNGDADVVCKPLDPFHIEVKRRERLDIHGAVEQARQDGPGKIPLVLHRRDRHEWLITMPAGELLKILGRAYGQ